MNHPETHPVTVENGYAPAGKPGHCCWCQRPMGGDHAPDCVCRKRTIVIRAVVEHAVIVPEDWTAEDIARHRNEGSWCADNWLSELEGLTMHGGCLCGAARFDYLREATAEDEERVFGPDWEGPLDRRRARPPEPVEPEEP